MDVGIVQTERNVKMTLKTLKDLLSSCGAGSVILMTVVFIILKLLGKLDWGWWWVLSPLWIAGIIILLILLIFAVFIV